MKHSLTIIALCLLGFGCAPSDQFWQKPDIGKEITSIEEALKAPDAVRYLNLNATSQKAFPDDILKLKNLERLSLRQNTITSLPEGIGTLPALKWMDLGSIGLTSLPPSVGSLQNLAHLYVNDNALTQLPEELGTCPKLEYLNADRNKLTTLPASIGKLSSLKWLRLNGNQLTALPSDLSGLATNLRRLYLKGNPIPDPEKARIKAALPNCEIIF